VHYLGVPEWVGRRITRSIYGFYFTRVDHIIAPSAQVRARLDRMGVKVPCTVIPTGIDAGFFQHGDAQKVRSELGLNGDEVVFCFIGRIGEEKSIDFVLSCFAEAAREKPELRLLVIGNGQALAGLRKLAAKLGVADQVLFTGSRPRAELRNYLAASRAFLFASETETQGLVLLEAAAAGVPVCAVRASGVSDAVVDGETGVLLHSGDRVAFVRTILDLAARPDWARRLGQHGASWVERFSTVEMARQVLEVYHQAIERNSVRRSQR
jgi:1,2-diacylglycerol 3-alpha-glucosyltransferase